MLLPRLYCRFQAGLSLGFVAQFTPGKPNGTYFDKEPRGNKCNHPKTEITWRHGASEHMPVVSKGHLGPRWGPQPCLWGQRPPVLFCPSSPWDVQRTTTSRILSKIPFWFFLGFRSWQERAGSEVRLRRIDRMQKGTCAESDLAESSKTLLFSKKSCHQSFFFFLQKTISFK